MGDNFYFEPSDPAFKAHKGYFPKEGLINALGAYDKYVKGEGRDVSLPNWLGTAVQEGGIGKYDKFTDDRVSPMFAIPHMDEKYNKLAAVKYGAPSANPEDVMRTMEQANINPYIDYAAYKLDQGKKKLGTDEGAARWYNYYDKVPREKLPQLGRDVLKNPTVQKIMQNITDFYSGQQYKDKLKMSDKPLEGGLF